MEFILLIIILLVVANLGNGGNRGGCGFGKEPTTPRPDPTNRRPLR
ncbi:MAG TPA: hypothetical protein PKD05_16705 [Candidatus Melainabacteria bacterium]|nr:hypothetical protein [Candidatus Melainabacteria bacterium]